MTEVEDAQEVGKILTTHYDTLKHHPYGTIWGVAYHWDRKRETLSETPSEENCGGLIDLLLDNSELKKPVVSAGVKDTINYRMLVCASNGRIINQSFFSLAGYQTHLIAIVTGARLFREATDHFLAYHGGPIHFWEFMLRYNVEKNDFSENTSYRALFERLYLDYGAEEMDTTLDLFLDQERREKVKEKNLSVHANDLKMSPQLEALRKELGNSNLPIRLSRPHSNLRQYFGKVRVRSQIGTGVIDWEEWLQKRESQREGKLSFNLDNWVRELFYQEEAQRAWQMTAEDQHKAEEYYKSLATREENPEKALIYHRILEEITFLPAFDTSKHLNRKMTICTTKK